MYALVFTIIFGRLAGMPTNGIPYPIFVMSGLIVWLFVAQAFPQASASIVTNPHLVTRIYFPRIILPMSTITTSLADFLVSLVLLFILMAWYGIAPSAGVLLFVPMMLVAVATVLGLSLWFSALYVPFRDVGHLLPFLVTIWMFLCPVVYPSTLLPEKYAFLVHAQSNRGGDRHQPLGFCRGRCPSCLRGIRVVAHRVRDLASAATGTFADRKRRSRTWCKGKRLG